VIDIFDQPRLFHLGMDEETAHHQRYNRHVLVRKHDLWWHDLYLLVEAVERGGSRAWVWADTVWSHPEVFVKKMPRSVLQSNWYYGKSFARNVRTGNPFKAYDHAVRSYAFLDKHGYDQVPTGSNHGLDVNFERTVRHCRKAISPKRLKGFMQSSWKITREPFRKPHMEAIEQVGRAMAWWNRR
jgi:hypothetical protein